MSQPPTHANALRSICRWSPVAGEAGPGAPGTWDVVIVRGGVEDNRLHQHHAIQVCLSAAVETDAVVEQLNGPVVTGALVAIDGGVTHSLTMRRGTMALVPPESPLGAAIRENWLDGEPVAATAVTRHDKTRLPFSTSGTGATGPSLQDLLAALVPKEPRPIEPRVHTVLRWLAQAEAEGRWSDVTLNGALLRVHLSPDRFRHVWTDAMGTPWRTYLRWRRALVALALASAGRTLTECAHLAGYADSAHLSRQVADQFGFTPSHILKVSRFVQGDGHDGS